MIAMALLPEPRMIIADEPTTALDVTIQAQILKLLRSVAVERGVSVLFTTHDLGAAYEICDRITVMYAGQEVETAISKDFFSDSKNGTYFYSNGWQIKGVYSMVIGFIFAASTIWNAELRFLQSFAWLIGAFVSYITYYLMASK